LIEQGANLNLPDFTGKQVLHFAVLGNNVELVDFILQHGGDVNAQDVDGLTPTHYAATLGNVSALVSLFRFGSFVNAQDHQGETALFYAVREGKIHAVKLLLQSGADPTLQNEDEETVIELCQDLGEQNMLAVFGAALQSIPQQRRQFEIFQNVNTCESGKIQSNDFDGCAMDSDAPCANATFLFPEQRPLSFV
jgi:ankyrin repeat protein